MSEQFWSHYGWPLATAILVTIFTILVFLQYLQRKRMHQLSWTIGLSFYAIAAYMEAYSEFIRYWDPFIYRMYIVLAASLVGFLGLGTVYLMARNKRWGHLYLTFNLISLIIFLVGALTVDLDLSKMKPGVTVGGTALGPSLSFPRVCSLLFNIPGSIFLLGGAVLSAIKFARKTEFVYRMWANILIAIGTIVIAWAGARARLGTTAGLYPAEMVGASFLFAGFLVAGTLEKGAKAVRERISGIERKKG